jgi:hypothetical protein
MIFETYQLGSLLHQPHPAKNWQLQYDENFDLYDGHILSRIEGICCFSESGILPAIPVKNSQLVAAMG